MELINSILNDDNDLNQYRKTLSEEFMDIMRVETAGVSNKFNWFDYTSKDGLRPVMNGIFHDNGEKVATDSHILVVMKEDYPEDYEGKILMKDGELKDQERVGRFPNWKCVMPESTEGRTPVKIDFDRADKIFKDIRVKCRFDKLSVWKVKVGGVLYNWELLQRMFKFMRYIGTDVMWNDEKSIRAGYVENGGNRAILMPMRSTEDHVVVL